MLKIALTNLRRYNEGELVFEWIDLPCDDFEPIFDKLGHDEYFISDFECEVDHIELSEYANLSLLNELAQKYESLDRGEKIILQAIVEAETNDLSKAFEILENECYIFYEVENLEELAEEFIEDGLFGKIPKELESYIDYEKIARDLKYEGYIKTSVGIICFY